MRLWFLLFNARWQMPAPVILRLRRLFVGMMLVVGLLSFGAPVQADLPEVIER